MSSQTTLPKETASHQSSGMGVVSLIQVVQNLITLGLTSIDKWTDVIPKLKTHVKYSSQPENLNLQLILTQITNHLVTRVFDFFPNDLSQHKLPHMLASQIPTKDLLKVLKRFLNKKTFVDKTFSLDCSNDLNSAVEDILGKNKINIDSDDDDEDQEIPKEQSFKKTHNQRKRKRSRSPSPSKSSLILSEVESIDNSDIDSESESENHNFDKLFKNSKEGPVKIKQIFQTQKKLLKKKLTTPGEEGRYMIKIELTDTNDLKNCSCSQYWTKVSAKAIFLTEKKSPMLKQVNKLLYDVGCQIKGTPGVECDEVKFDKRLK